jgi:hypothetical protein
MTKPVVFIAAAGYQFDSAVKAEKFARDAGAEVLNPAVSLPCGLPRCCYLPIELAMLEASDILWLLGNCENVKTRSLVHYALAQNITVVLSEQELIQELALYTDNEQMILEGFDEEC